MISFKKLFSRKKKKRDQVIAGFILNKFGYTIKDCSLFRTALTHKSKAHINHEESNERLEFFGDAILDAIIAELLYHRFPYEDEGYLTKVKSKIVSRRTLGNIAHEMNLSSIIQFSKNRSINLATIEGNAFEAIIGAIYLDGGYKAVKNSISQHVFIKYINLNEILEEEIDFKSRLFIWSQKNRIPIEFDLIEEENLGNKWKYVIRVLINDQEYGIGFGSSKKKAEQAASRETLELIGEL